MSDPTARLLRLLDLLQSHRWWSGPDLAERLGTSPRTVRRDVDRLRELGYVVESAPGAEGGYQLAAGATLPPLLLDDDEAVALAVGLRTAAVAGRGAEAAARTMAKLDQVLPAPLRRRAAALTEHVVDLGSGPRAAPDVLGELALACRDHERARFDYRDKDGRESRRHVEPQRLVVRSGRWYLLCHDVDRADWRTFRLDRLGSVRRTGARFAPREITEEEVEARFADFVRPTHRAEILLDQPVSALVDAVGHWAADARAEVVDGREATRWTVTGHLPQDVLVALLWIPAGWGWSVRCDAEVAAMLGSLRDRLAVAPIEEVPIEEGPGVSARADPAGSTRR